MVEKWKKCLDKGGIFGALLTDLSKAFDCIPHDLLIAKLDAYGFDLPSLKFLNSYLTNRKQRIKINNAFSDWTDLHFGVPQGSILGPILFNIFLCDLFLFLPNVDVASYADDNTPYSAGNTVDEVLCSLQNSSKSMFDWFENNGMRANPEKSDLILTKPNTIETQICGETINSTEIVKLLGINIDNKLTFEQHVDSLCNKASQKLNALARLAHYMSFEQRKLIMNSFITSQFSYCPLVWMFHSRRLNHRINRIQERALRIVYRDYNSSFTELLLKDGSLTIHQRNLHILVTEIYKANNGISPVLMKEMFEFPESKYNLRNTKN